MPLVYLPDVEALFLWGSEPAPRALPGLGRDAQPWTTTLVTPEGRRAVEGSLLPLLDTMATLAVVPAAELELLPASVASWVLASKLAIELAARERVVPTLRRLGGRIEARWAAALSTAEDAAKVLALARSMPPAAHAVPAGVAPEVWAPDALLRAYLDAVVDALVRAAHGGPELASRDQRRPKARVAAWDQRWHAALAGPQRSFETQGFGERAVVDDLTRWSEPALGARDRLRACFRLELPEADHGPFRLRFLLQSPDEPQPPGLGRGRLANARPQLAEARARVSRSAGVAARGARTCRTAVPGDRPPRWPPPAPSRSSSIPGPPGASSARARRRWRRPASG